MRRGGETDVRCKHGQKHRRPIRWSCGDRLGEGARRGLPGAHASHGLVVDHDHADPAGCGPAECGVDVRGVRPDIGIAGGVAVEGDVDLMADPADIRRVGLEGVDGEDDVAVISIAAVDH